MKTIVTIPICTIPFIQLKPQLYRIIVIEKCPACVELAKQSGMDREDWDIYDPNKVYKPFNSNPPHNVVIK